MTDLRPAFRIVAALLCCSTPALAEVPSVYDRVGRLWAEAGIGVFAPQKSGNLSGQRGSGTLALGAGYRQSRNLAWGVDVSGFDQSFDTPAGAPRSTSIFTSVDSRAQLSTQGVDFNGRYIFASERWEPYVGGGLSWYAARMKVTGTTFFSSETIASETSNGVGEQAMTGFDYWIRPRIALGGELRYLRLNATFNTLAPGTTHVGGTFLTFRYRQSF